MRGYSQGAIIYAWHTANFTETYKSRIKELMRENSLNQVQLAARAGISQNTISAWLLGKKEPSIRSLWLLADYFNVDIDYLVGRTDY